jgi:hypothetical protein
MKKTLILLVSVFILINQATAQFQYQFPSPASVNNLPATHLILRHGDWMDETTVTADRVILTGSLSGIVPAKVVLSTDGQTICITPEKSFRYTETVNVEVKEGFKTMTGQVLSGLRFDFSIRREMTPKEKQELEHYLATHDDGGNLLNDPNQLATYVPAPEIEETRTQKFDFINLYTNSGPTAGQLFFHRNSGASPTSSVGKGYGIMESNGDSVFYRPTFYDGSNFRVNTNGQLTALRLESGVDTGIIVLDSSYNKLYQVNGKGSLHPSQHEHLLLPDGTIWYTVYDWQPGWDLSQYGGNSSATVNVSWIQAQDKNGNIIFSWRSDQHFAITDATSDISFGTGTVDPWHINSMFIEADGNLLCSFRNQDAIVKIKKSNGDVLWYWGGVGASHSDFVTLNDPDGGFSHQHHVQRLSNGNIILFDNGNLHVPQVSKPKEYTLDEVNMVATNVWYYTHPQVNGFNMYTKNQGSVTRFENGNTLIGYGLPNIQGLPNGAEIDAGGNIVWEFRFKDSTEYTYRLYKTEWNPVGIKEVDASGELSVFPNPGNGRITLNFENALTGEVKLEVFDLTGRRLYFESLTNAASLRNKNLDLTSLDVGFYVLKISSGKQKMVSKIVIQ